MTLFWTRRDLTHPLVLLAIGLLLLNDHALKGSGLLPGWVTGKLSDVVGLFFFPILLVTVARPVTPRGLRGRPAALLAALGTGAVFALLKLSPAMNAIAASWWGRLVMDPTDLLALPSLGLSVLFLESREPATPAPRWFQAGTVLLAAGASIATPAPMYRRAYPEWAIAGPSEQVLACAHVRAFVARSGKQGVGIGFEVEGQGCEVRATARLRIGPRTFEAAKSEERVIATSQPQFLYAAIPFDNEASWNDGERRGELDLIVVAGGEQRAWSTPAEHRFEGYYVPRYPQSNSAEPPRPPGPPPAPTRTFATPPPGAPAAPPGGPQ